MPLKHLQHMQHSNLLCNIYTKHSQHISETLETYVCNMRFQRNISLLLGNGGLLARGVHRCRAHQWCGARCSGGEGRGRSRGEGYVAAHHRHPLGGRTPYNQHYPSSKPHGPVPLWFRRTAYSQEPRSSTNSRVQKIDISLEKKDTWTAIYIEQLIMINQSEDKPNIAKPLTTFRERKTYIESSSFYKTHGTHLCSQRSWSPNPKTNLCK